MAMNERFKKVFSLLKIKESDAATVCNVSTRTISRLKHNEVSAIPVDVLINIREVYGVNLNWLITGKGDIFSDKKDLSVLQEPVSTYSKNEDSKLQTHLEEENKWLREKYDDLMRILTNEGVHRETGVRNSG